MKVVAFFDLDCTITKKDTFGLFLLHCFSTMRLVARSLTLIPTLIRYKLKLLANGIAKEIVFSSFFRGMDYQYFTNLCLSFKDTIKQNINHTVMERLRWHQAQGHGVIIVSASIEDWIKPWATELGITHVLGTRLEIIQNRLTGRFATPNCSGEEKVNRIKKEVEMNFSYAYGYGNSADDKHMLEICDSKFIIDKSGIRLKEI